MSLFGAMSTAISGLSAQSAAFGNISDNVANSQTVGFKRIDTSFDDLLTTSTATTNESGAVLAHPDYVNNVQGTISQTDNPLNMAIAGQGFFAVSRPATSSTTGATVFNPQTYYTRAGDFSMNKDGYLVNSEGDYLMGWSVDATTGTVNSNQLAPIQVNQGVSSPVPTSGVTMQANLPATPSAATPISSDIQVYDADGTTHDVNLSWTQNTANDWTVTISSADSTPTTLGTAEIQFGPNTSGNNVPDGTIGNILNTTGTVTTSGFSANGPASLSFTPNFGSGNQPIQLNLGDYGQDNGLTQFAGTNYTLENLSQNGLPQGSFSGITTDQNGDIVVNYNNGQSTTVAQVPVTVFPDPDALQRQNGQAFTATYASGQATTQTAGINGAGTLTTSAVESSNVDIATQFSNLIVAQQAYSANAKIISTANDMLQQTLNMKQ